MSQILSVVNHANRSAGQANWLRSLIVTGCATALILAGAPLGF